MGAANASDSVGFRQIFCTCEGIGIARLSAYRGDVMMRDKRLANPSRAPKAGAR
jgi:hypothetical protein